MFFLWPESKHILDRISRSSAKSWWLWWQFSQHSFESVIPKLLQIPHINSAWLKAPVPELMLASHCLINFLLDPSPRMRHKDGTKLVQEDYDCGRVNDLEHVASANTLLTSTHTDNLLLALLSITSTLYKHAYFVMLWSATFCARTHSIHGLIMFLPDSSLGAELRC